MYICFWNDCIGFRFFLFYNQIYIFGSYVLLRFAKILPPDFITSFYKDSVLSSWLLPWLSHLGEQIYTLIIPDLVAFRCSHKPWYHMMASLSNGSPSWCCNPRTTWVVKWEKVAISGRKHRQFIGLRVGAWECGQWNQEKVAMLQDFIKGPAAASVGYLLLAAEESRPWRSGGGGDKDRQ